MDIVAANVRGQRFLVIEIRYEVVEAVVLPEQLFEQTVSQVVARRSLRKLRIERDVDLEEVTVVTCPEDVRHRAIVQPEDGHVETADLVQPLRELPIEREDLGIRRNGSILAGLPRAIRSRPQGLH